MHLDATIYTCHIFKGLYDSCSHAYLNKIITSSVFNKMRETQTKIRFMFIGPHACVPLASLELSHLIFTLFICFYFLKSSKIDINPLQLICYLRTTTFSYSLVFHIVNVHIKHLNTFLFYFLIVPVYFPLFVCVSSC